MKPGQALPSHWRMYLHSNLWSRHHWRMSLHQLCQTRGPVSFQSIFKMKVSHSMFGPVRHLSSQSFSTPLYHKLSVALLFLLMSLSHALSQHSVTRTKNLKLSQYYIITIMMTPFMRVSQKLMFHQSKCISAIKHILSTVATCISSSFFMYLCISCHCDVCLQSSALRVGVKTLHNTIALIPPRTKSNLHPPRTRVHNSAGSQTRMHISAGSRALPEPACIPLQVPVPSPNPHAYLCRFPCPPRTRMQISAGSQIGRASCRERV